MCRAWSGSKLFKTLTMKEFFEKDDFEKKIGRFKKKKSADDKNAKMLSIFFCY